jgi:hypothetical protein
MTLILRFEIDTMLIEIRSTSNGYTDDGIEDTEKYVDALYELISKIPPCRKLCLLADIALLFSTPGPTCENEEKAFLEASHELILAWDRHDEELETLCARNNGEDD